MRSRETLDVLLGWKRTSPPPFLPIGIDHRALTPHTRVVVYVFVVTTNRLINSLPFPAKRDLRLILLLPRKLFRSRSSPAAAASRLYVILRDSTRHCAFYLLYPRSLSLSIERISSSLYLLIHPLVLKLFVRKVTRSIKKKRKEKIPREKKETRSRRRRQRGSTQRNAAEVYQVRWSCGCERRRRRRRRRQS